MEETPDTKKHQTASTEEDTSTSSWMDKAKFMQVTKKQKDLKDSDPTTFKGFMQDLLRHIQGSDVTALGAQLAFYFLLSLFPLLIFMITLLPYLNLPEDQIFQFLRNYAPAEVFALIEGTLTEVLENRNGGLLSVGLLGTIWSASNGVNAIVKSLNKSYGLEETRPFYIARGLSVVFTILIIILFVIALVLPIFGQQIGVLLFSIFGLDEMFLSIWNSLRFTIPPLIIFVVLTAMYLIVPNDKLYFKSVIPGGIFATIGWIVVSLGFSFYVSNFSNYTATYGSLGTMIVLMMWLYFSGTILMIGGQINAVIQDRRERLEERKAG